MAKRKPKPAPKQAQTKPTDTVLVVHDSYIGLKDIFLGKQPEGK